MPKVTVSIPCYNATATPKQERWFRTAIESVLNQTVEDLELLLVDDGSTDDTSAVCEEYTADSRVTYIYQENQGYPGARNTGLDRGDGNFVAFIGQDDRWYPEKLERQLSVLEETGADMLHTNVHHIDGVGETTGIRHPERPPVQNTRKPFIRELFLGNFICIQSVLVRWPAIASYRFDENLRINSDHLLWMQIAGEHDIRYIDDLLIAKRYHGGNQSSNFERIFEERQYVADVAIELYPFLKDLWHVKMGDAYSMYGLQLLKDAQLRQARSAFRTAISYHRTNWESYAGYLLSLGGSTVGPAVASYLSDSRPGRSIDHPAADEPIA
jgi:glycosyltransferase involved in cell wall biosynthesis